MPTIPELKFGFLRGYQPDGGPFFVQKGFYRDGANVVHDTTGLITNRPGLELLDETKVLTVDYISDATNLFVASTHFGEITKLDGTLMNCVFWRCGSLLKIFANDGGTYTSSLENLDLLNPDFTFTLPNVSDEAVHYKTTWGQEGNTIIMTSHRSPIYKVIWGKETTGSETFTGFPIQITEVNEDLYELPAAKTKTEAGSGWYSVEIPLKTGKSTYIVDQFFGKAVPGFTPTVYEYDTDGLSTYLTTGWSIAETIDTDIKLITLTLTYAGTTGKRLRIYLGRTSIVDQTASLARDQLVISGISKDFNSGDNSFAPSRVLNAAGRVWFTGIEGALDGTDFPTYPGLGTKYKKVWISKVFPAALLREEASTILCEPDRGPYDVYDNAISLTDGGIFEPDNAAKIFDIADKGTNIYVIAKNGVWALSGKDEVFSLTETRSSKVVDAAISSREAVVSTDSGLFVFGDNDVYWIEPAKQTGADLSSYTPPVVNLVEGRIASLYRTIPIAAKKQAFVRYDEYNRRIYYFYSSSPTTNKYNVSGTADKFLVFDITTQAWMAPADISGGDWSIVDMITIPADAKFTAPDPRFTKNKYVNLVMLTKKSGNATEFTWAILEGKNYCTDYYGTTYKTAFTSYVETFNSFAEQLGVLSNKQTVRLQPALLRTELVAATDGFYEFPGAVYLGKRYDFADHANAGPLFAHKWNSAGNSWDANLKQIYFPAKLGSTVVGGGKLAFEVIVPKLKLTGKGTTISLRFGNKFGDTSLTGTILEQEKPWGVYGYQLLLKGGT